MIANYSTTNNFAFIFASDLKIVYYNNDHNALDKREEIIFRQSLLGDKIIQNCIKIDATHSWDNDLLLRQETQKRLYVLEVIIIIIIIIIIINIDLMSLAQRMNFLQDVLQMTAVAFVSVIIIILKSCIYFETSCIYFLCCRSFRNFAQLHDIKYSFLIQITCTQL